MDSILNAETLVTITRLAEQALLSDERCRGTGWKYIPLIGGYGF